MRTQYGMLDPSNLGDTGLPLTCRAVFIVGPDKKLKLTLNYPASVGRCRHRLMWSAIWAGSLILTGVMLLSSRHLPTAAFAWLARSIC